MSTLETLVDSSFFAAVSQRRILIYHIFSSLSTSFLSFFTFFNLLFIPKKMEAITASKRRKRDLNPRAAINDLLPFQGSPFGLLGISPNAYLTMFLLIQISCGKKITTTQWLSCQTEKVGFEPTVPFGITGFQDQLLKPLGHLSMS